MNYENLVRKIRQSPKLFADDSVKIDRVLAEAKRRMLATRKSETKVGQWSGLTRRELAQSGTCETDWY